MSGRDIRFVFGVISAADSHVENSHSGWMPENWLAGVGKRADVLWVPATYPTHTSTAALENE